MEKGSNLKIIITDVEYRKPFDVVNMMQWHYNYDCILCAAKHTNTFLPLIYRQKIYKLRIDEFENFRNDFKKILIKFEDCTLIYLPLSENTIHFFYKFVDSYSSPNLLYKLPDKESFEMTGDKGQFQTYCEKQSYPVPKKYFKKGLEALKEDFRPLVLKPRSGQGSIGIEYFYQAEELQKLEDYNLEDYIIQDKVISHQKVIGAFFLCDNGETVSTYTHQRLRTFPVEGGMTVYSKSTYNEEVIEIGRRLLSELNWNGLAMIEFMYDEPAAEWKIIELNPRIWGSILLSSFNESDFLDDYVFLCLGKKLQKRGKSKPVYIRWLFPFEFINLMKGDINLDKFFTFNRKKTCYINFTYSSWWRSFSYLLYFTFNKDTLTRFFKKIF